jgi:hypothetical protein
MRTSLYSILCIVVRLGAVLLLVQTLASLPGAWDALQGWERQSGEAGGAARGMLIGFSGALIALAIALWLYPGLLARLAAGNASGEVFDSPIAAKELHFIAFSVLGIVFAIGALLGLVSTGLRIALSAHFGDVAFTTLAWQNGIDLFVLFLKLALGIGLSLGARGLVGLLHRLRERGLPPPRYDAEPEEAPPAKE